MAWGRELKSVDTGTWQHRYELRGWQVAALDVWKQSNRGVVSVVTGGGKTVFAEACLKHFFQQHPDGRAMIVVPTTALLDQWFLSLQDELSVPKEEIGLLSGTEKPQKGQPIIVGVINSVRTLAGRWGAGKPRMLIVDECHRAGSPENGKALDGSFEAALGLSATPVREYDSGFDDYVKPALGPVIYEYDYVQAYRDGIITPFRLENVEASFLSDEQAKYDKINKRIALYSKQLKTSETQFDERMKRLLQERASISATATMRIPIAAKLIENHRGERAIVFHERTSAANKIADILKERRHSVALYHSGMAPAIRRENLRLFRKGVFDILVCCRALDEGMNVPETSVAVIASSTASHRQRIQRLGRILRPAKGKTGATVYTIFVSREERNRLEQEAQRLEDISETTWRTGRVRRDA